MTRHGPIVTELVPGETRQLALRWTLYDGLRIPFFDVDSAQNWDEFRHAFSLLDAPGQNVVYADVDGNIGYQATGKDSYSRLGRWQPAGKRQRTTPMSGSATFPSINCPASIIRHRESSPPRTAGSLLTNIRIRSASEWEAPWRAEPAIYHVLESGRKFARRRHAGTANRH